MSGTFWAITSYFNPAGSTRRLANYRAFRKALACPLLTVEWAPEGRFQLGADDADLLVQVAGGDLMWQKERLLNLGVQRLPPDCRHVAWLDCDIVFERSDWVMEATRRLEDAPLVQLYDQAVYLAKGSLRDVNGIGDLRSRARLLERTSFAAARHRGLPAPMPVATEDLGMFARMPSAGLAWAAVRELIERHPLFDVWIIGGGDSAYALAAAGSADQVVSNHALAPGHRDLFLPRAADLAGEVRGRIGVVTGTIYHLWHGEFADRRYRSRHGVLTQHQFDPSRFLRMSPTGTWSWGEVPASLPLAVRDYLEGRREDGTDARAS